MGAFNASAQTTYTWTGGGGPANQQWGKNNNWAGVGAPANNTTNFFVFSGAVREFTPENDRTNISAASIVFATNSATNAQTYNLVGNSLNLLGGVTNFSTAWHTISLDLVLAANSVQFNTAAGNLTLAGVISGGGSLTKSGTGMVMLSGANTYSGGTLVNAGVLSGDTTSLRGNITNNASVIFNQSTNGTYAGVLSGTGTLLKTNTATLILSGANTQSGGTLVSAGTLQIGNGGTNGSLSGVITNNASLLINRSDNLTQSGVISGSGLLTKNGAGTLTLTGANTYSGGTLVNAGALSGDTTSLRGNITNNGSVIFDQLTNGTYAGVLSGTGTLFKRSAATLILSGANTPSGGTFVSAGTLQIGSGGTTGSLGGVITNNASLAFNRSDNLTQSGVISGSGSLTKNGAGTVTLSGANTFTGATTVSAGTLNLNSAAGSALGSTTSVSVSNGATLLVSRSNQVNDSSAVTLSGGTIRRGAGVSEAFGNLNLTAASFLDFGTGASGTLSFGTYTPSALLSVGNFFQGNVLTFQQDLSGSINNRSLFVFDNSFTTNWNGSSFTITAIPEPSAFVAAAVLLGVMLWPSRRRIVRDFKRIAGLRAPMRDRLARMR